MTHEEMEAGVRSYFDAVGKGDRARLLEIFAPDLRWRVPNGAIEPYAGLHEGAETIVATMLGAVGGAFVPGSQETEMRAQTPAGDEYRNSYCFFFEFHDGRISEIREHVDTRYAANFFGGENE